MCSTQHSQGHLWWLSFSTAYHCGCEGLAFILGSTCPRWETVASYHFPVSPPCGWLPDILAALTALPLLQAYLFVCDLNFKVRKRTVTSISALGPEKFALWVVNCEVLVQINPMVNGFLLGYWIFGHADQSHLGRGSEARDMPHPCQSPSLSLRPDVSHCSAGTVNHSLCTSTTRGRRYTQSFTNTSCAALLRIHKVLRKSHS